MATEARHAIGIFARSGACAVHGVAANADEQHFVAFAVGHHGGIAEAAVHGTAHACAIADGELIAPGQSVVLRDACHDVHLTETDVAAAGTIVADGYQVAVVRFGNGRDAVGRAAAVGDEEVLLRLRLAEAAADVDCEVAQLHLMVVAVQGELGRNLLQPRHFKALCFVGYAVFRSAGGQFQGIAVGNFVLELEFVAGDDVVAAGRDGVHAVLGLSGGESQVVAVLGHVVETGAEGELRRGGI